MHRGRSNTFPGSVIIHIIISAALRAIQFHAVLCFEVQQISRKEW